MSAVKKLRIKAGRFYVTRDGRIAGPASYNGKGTPKSLEFTVPLDGHPATYWRNGARWGSNSESNQDLVSEAEGC